MRDGASIFKLTHHMQIRMADAASFDEPQRRIGELLRSSQETGFLVTLSVSWRAQRITKRTTSVGSVTCDS